MSGPVNAPQKNRNARTAWTMAAVVGGMLGLAYASAPLYDLFCRTTGFGGTPQVAVEGERPVLARTVKVRFDSNVDVNLPWRFQPLHYCQGVHARCLERSNW